MDTSLLFLINGLVTNANINMYNILLILITLATISHYGLTVVNFCEMIIKKCFRKKNSFTIEGYIILNYWRSTPLIPDKMAPIVHYLIKNKHITNVSYLDKNIGNEEMKKDISFSCILDQVYDLKINNDIHISHNKQKMPVSDKREMVLEITKYSLLLQSNNTNLIDFVNTCVKEYEEYILKLSSNKLYHFIFRGREKLGKDESHKDGELLFSSSIMSDLVSNKSNETFDHIIHEHKDRIINDIEQLKNRDYYKKTGTKRKKGYLFTGPPGCGKTSTVMAMANYDNRHIIEIPFSRLKKNKDIEDIINLKEIHGIKFEKHEIILLFDEIDSGYDYMHEKEAEYTVIESTEEDDKKDIKKVKKEDDKISIGFLLSRLDGIGNYDGLIIVATTNNPEKIDKAVYRDGRLTLINYNYCNKDAAIKFIEKFYNTKLTQEQLDKIPNDLVDLVDLVPAKLIGLMEKHKDSIDDLLLSLK